MKGVNRMKKIIFLLAFILLLTSCGSNSASLESTEEQLNLESTASQNQPPSQEAGEESNSTPEEDISFLGDSFSIPAEHEEVLKRNIEDYKNKIVFRTWLSSMFYDIEQPEDLLRLGEHDKKVRYCVIDPSKDYADEAFYLLEEGTLKFESDSYFTPLEAQAICNSQKLFSVAPATKELENLTVQNAYLVGYQPTWGISAYACLAIFFQTNQGMFVYFRISHETECYLLPWDEYRGLSDHWIERMNSKVNPPYGFYDPKIGYDVSKYKVEGFSVVTSNNVLCYVTNWGNYYGLCESFGFEGKVIAPYQVEWTFLEGFYVRATFNPNGKEDYPGGWGDATEYAVYDEPYAP